MTIPAFKKKILSWYQENKRDFPFRKTRDPYKILVSEVMLQQTQMARVLPKYKQFLKEFPNFKKLASVSRRRLLSAWQGLGYWRRALFLRKTARNTARAVLCFAFGNKEAFLDTNIRRVYLHFFFPSGQKVSDKEILAIAQKAISQKNPREWHYALLDYGATVLKNSNINKKSRAYRRQSPFKNSFRSFRTKALRFVLAQPRGKLPCAKLHSFIQEELRAQKSAFLPQEIILALIKDNLLKKSREYYFV